ncbi:hypothetical protein ISN45_Aa04g028280 [Arabidopsis thaliana x Arabidopsis arenosa]|uniref:Uncharacterized protein n=1 Tax=Arabidopsis thaliana x Arabidopsis arenosa TaxID=1240361 RepID=A0A8T2A9F6_9BRAS|nr:hypothetical protein ISN45_Aa04g028280 [Arabidopsis thaliana x Arabidopsis arenosa]
MKFLQRSSAYFNVGIDHLLHGLDPLCNKLAELCCGRNYSNVGFSKSITSL